MEILNARIDAIGLLRICSYWIAISTAIGLYLTIWVQGTLAGTYAVIAYTNLYGEHYYELVLLGIFLPIALCFFLLDLKRFAVNMLVENRIWVR